MFNYQSGDLGVLFLRSHFPFSADSMQLAPWTAFVRIADGQAGAMQPTFSGDWLQETILGHRAEGDLEAF